MALTRNPKKVCTVIGLALFAMMLVWLGGVYLGRYLVGQAAPEALSLGWAVWLINDIPLYFMAAPVFLLLLRLVPDGPTYPRPRYRVGPARWLFALLFCFGVTYALNYVTTLLILLLQVLFRNSSYLESLTEMTATGGLLTNLFFGAVVPALGEEFLFRYTLRRKLRGCADSTYIMMSGLCFGLFHANLQQIPYAFAVGMVFAWLYLITGNIWLPVSLHFVVNVFGLIVMPKLALNLQTMGLVTAFVMMAVAMAITGYFVWRRRAAATLLPPTEPGWPYNPPRRPVVAHPLTWPAQGPGPSAVSIWQQWDIRPPFPYVPPGQRAAMATLPPGHPPYTPPRQRTYFVSAPNAPAPVPPPLAPPAPAAMPRPAYAATATRQPAFTLPPAPQTAASQMLPPPLAPQALAAGWQPAPPPWPVTIPVVTARPPKQRTLRFCLANPGMVLYILVAAVATALSFARMFL